MAAIIGRVESPAPRSRHRRDLRPLFWVLRSSWFGFLTWSVIANFGTIRPRLLVLVPWIALGIVANLLPIKGGEVAILSVDLPVNIAAGLVLSPLEAALVVTVAAVDLHEIRGDIGLAKTLSNRSHIGVSCYAAALVVHALSAEPASSAAVLPLSLLALVILMGINYLVVLFVVTAEDKVPASHVLRQMKIGTLGDYGLTLVTWAVLAAMLTVFYAHSAAWALLAFLAPMLAGRQVLARSQMFLEARRAYQSRENALVSLSQLIHEERADERRIVAAALHDEVLQPIFKVSLMTQVLKRDISGGRLPDIEQDVREVEEAADIASQSLRELVGNIRRSDLGTGTVSEALSSLFERLRQQTTAEILGQVETVRADPGAQLTVYQIAKEALENAIAHSRARSIRTELRQEQNQLILVVSDDGVGFDLAASRDGHFGIDIMQERAAAAQGSLFIDTWPSQGCRVTALIPSSTRSSDL